jgi:hypothetical protein
LIEQQGQLHLSNLAQVMGDAGLEVAASQEPIDGNRLTGVDALVISGAFAPLQEGEIGVVLGFLEGGGSLAVMLHIGPPVAELLTRLEVAISNGVIRERSGVLGENPLDFRVTRLAPHALTQDIPHFNIFGSWALMPFGQTGKVLAKTGPQAWVDLNGNEAFDPDDAMQEFGVIVAGKYGKGHYVVYGDDAVFQNRFLEGENLKLARNLARWMLDVDAGARLVAASDLSASHNRRSRGATVWKSIPESGKSPSRSVQ